MKGFRHLTVATVILLLFVLCISVAFADGDTLRLPDGTAVIEEEAFCGDISLNKVVLPQGIEAIGSRAFAGSSLRSINLPNSLNFGSIAEDAFDSTQLQYVTVNYTAPAGYWAREHQNSLGYEIIYEYGDNSVTSGTAHNVSATAAWVPLTYSVDMETAENGYRMGVAYSENADDIGIGDDGRLTCMDWTWGGESDVYGPANSLGFDGWLDEMIPEHTYWYSGCIVDYEGHVLYLEDSVRSFTTGNASEVLELSLEGEHGFASLGNAKTPFRFTAPVEGWYVTVADKTMDEISVRRTNEQGCGNANDSDRVNFYAEENETVYVFTRNFSEDAEVWIESAVVPENDHVSSEIDFSGENPIARVTLDVSGDTAQRDYGFGIEYSPVESFSDESGNRFANDFFWRFGDYRVRSNETEESGISNMIPGVTYYYRGFIDYCNGEPRLVEDSVHSFTAPGNVEDIPALTLETWSDIPADQETIFRFTAPEIGWYAVQAEGMYYFNILQTDGSILRGTNEIENNEHYAVLVLGMGDGEPCYISVNGMDGGRIRVTQDSSLFFRISDEPQEVWDNRYFCFTAPEAGWYNLKVERTDFNGMRVFANLPSDEYSFWLDFYDDIDTQSIHALQAGDTFYFITWYDMNRGQQMVSIERVTPPESDSIAVTEVQTGDTWAAVELNYSVSLATQELACERQGYQVGIVYSDSELYFDGEQFYADHDETNYYGLLEDWGWNSRFSVEDGATLTRWLDRLIPNTTYYYSAYIRDAQSGEIFAHTDPASFTTTSATDDVLTLTLGRDNKVAVPEGSTVYRFTPEETAIYAVVSSGLDNLEIRGETGRWVAGDSIDWDDPDYAYCQGFIGEAGHEYYIFVGNHNKDVSLFVGYGDDELPELSDWWQPNWLDGRQVFRFTPSEDGWYRFSILTYRGEEGQICFAEPDRMYDNGGWPRYGDGTEVTRWLEAGQTVYPGCWFDSEWVWLVMKANLVVPPSEVSVTTLDVQDVSDVTALFGIELGIPELNVNDGANYTYGVQLLRYDNDPSFTGGSAWEQVDADMSMVNWNQTAPLELGYQSFFDNRPLEPDTSYWYEAFVGVYDPVENCDVFYYGGLKQFTTEPMQHTVTTVTENQYISVSWMDGDYQFFDFTVPQNAADFYDITVPESSIWVIKPNGNAMWPDWTDNGLHCVIPGKGYEGQTFRICLKLWNQNGTGFSVHPVDSLHVDAGAGQELNTGSIYYFTTPADGEYLIAATDGGRINVYQPEYDGFNHQAGWGWVTDTLQSGETVVFRCEQDNGKATTEVVITPHENFITTESELCSAVAAANQIANIRPYYQGFNIYVNDNITLSQDLELSTVVQLYLNSALTVPNGVTLTDHSDIYINAGGDLTVESGGKLYMEGIVNENGDPEWWATVNLNGGSFTETGVLWIDSAAIISVDDQFYNGDITQALSSVEGVPSGSIQLYIGVGDDGRLQQAKNLIQSYRYIGIRLIDGYSPEIASLTDFTMDKSHVIADAGTTLTVPTGTEQTLYTTLQLEGATLTVDGTLNIGDENDDGWLVFSAGGERNSFLNNGLVNIDDGSGITWYGPTDAVNNGTMNFADNSILRLSQRDGAVKTAEVNNANGTVNLGALAEWSEGISFVGGTVNQ